LTALAGPDRRLAMNPVLVIVVLGVLGLSVALVAVMRRRRSAGVTSLAFLAGWQDLAPAERIAEVEAWLSQTPRPAHERAAALILEGCAWLDRGRPDRATRLFQVAYHAEPDYASAGVLAFACMKVAGGRVEEMLATLMATWHEAGRPVLGSSRRERALLAACRRGDGPVGGSALAAALWSLPCASLRQQIGEALSRRPAWARPLWEAQPGGVGGDTANPAPDVYAKLRA